MVRPEKESQLVRRGGVLSTVRGAFDALPRSALVAGVVATPIAMFLVALLVEVSFDESTWKAHRWAVLVGLIAGSVVGIAVRILGGVGPGAGGYASVLGVLATAFGIVMGTMWKTDGSDVVATILEPMPLRPVAALFGAVAGAVLLIPEVSPFVRQRS